MNTTTKKEKIAVVLLNTHVHRLNWQKARAVKLLGGEKGIHHRPVGAVKLLVEDNIDLELKGI